MRTDKILNKILGNTKKINNSINPKRMFNKFKPIKEEIISGKSVQSFNNYPIPKKSVIKKAYDKIPDDTSIPLQFMTRKQYLTRYIKNQEKINNIDFSKNKEKQFIKQRTPFYNNIVGRYTTKTNNYYPPAVVVFNDPKNFKNIKGNNFDDLIFHEYGHELFEKNNLQMSLAKEEQFADNVSEYGQSIQTFSDKKAKKYALNKLQHIKHDNQSKNKSFYHGTSVKNIKNIKAEGLKINKPKTSEFSEDGYVYMSPSENYAATYALQTFSNPVLLKLNIDENKVTDDKYLGNINANKIISSRKVSNDYLEEYNNTHNNIWEDNTSKNMAYIKHMYPNEDVDDYILKRFQDSDEYPPTVRLYHGTRKADVENIKKEGILPQNKTGNRNFNNIATGFRDKTFLSQNKSSASWWALQHKQEGESVILGVDVPFEDYKKGLQNYKERYNEDSMVRDEDRDEIILPPIKPEQIKIISPYSNAVIEKELSSEPSFVNSRYEENNQRNAIINFNAMFGDIKEDNDSKDMTCFTAAEENEIHDINWNKSQKGKKLGEGHFAEVFEVKDNPNFVLKVSKGKFGSYHGSTEEEMNKFELFGNNKLIAPSFETPQGIVREKLNVISRGATKQDWDNNKKENDPRVIGYSFFEQNNITNNQAKQVVEGVNELSDNNILIDDELQIGINSKGKPYMFDIGTLHESKYNNYDGYARDENDEYKQRFLQGVNQEKHFDRDYAKEQEEAEKELNKY